MPAFLTPLMLRVIFWLVLAGGAAGFWFWGTHHYENIGYQKAIAAIAEKDKGALDAVKKRKDMVDNCYADGGNWDTTLGVCH